MLLGSVMAFPVVAGVVTWGIADGWLGIGPAVVREVVGEEAEEREVGGSGGSAADRGPLAVEELGALIETFPGSVPAPDPTTVAPGVAPLAPATPSTATTTGGSGGVAAGEVDGDPGGEPAGDGDAAPAPAPAPAGPAEEDGGDAPARDAGSEPARDSTVGNPGIGSATIPAEEDDSLGDDTDEGNGTDGAEENGGAEGE